MTLRRALLDAGFTRTADAWSWARRSGFVEIYQLRPGLYDVYQSEKCALGWTLAAGQATAAQAVAAALDAAERRAAPAQIGLPGILG